MTTHILKTAGTRIMQEGVSHSPAPFSQDSGRTLFALESEAERSSKLHMLCLDAMLDYLL